MDHAPDADLVGAARSGDRDAFAAIYDHHAPGIHRYCTMVIRDPDEAADVVQDTFVIAHRSLDRLRQPERLRPWLYAIARHEAIRRGRARARARGRAHRRHRAPGPMTPSSSPPGWTPRPPPVWCGTRPRG